MIVEDSALKYLLYLATSRSATVTVRMLMILQYILEHKAATLENVIEVCCCDKTTAVNTMNLLVDGKANGKASGSLLLVNFNPQTGDYVLNKEGRIIVPGLFPPAKRR